MSDELDDLKAAMQAATPDVDPARKAADLALAEKNFTGLQGSRSEVRPMTDSPQTGLWTGVMNMFARMSSRGGLVATTAIVAVGIVVLSPAGRDLLMPPGPARVVEEQNLAPQEEAEAPKVAGATEADAAADVSAPVAVAEADDALPEPMIEPAASAPAPARLRSVVQQERRIVLPDAEDSEAYATAEDNPLKVTVEEPVSTFSIDVDTASYAVIRDSLTYGDMPPRDAVRVEEMINYFPYEYPAPHKGDAFQPTVSVSPTPWNSGTQLVHIGLQGALPDLEDRPPLNLVFLIDTSGSMDQPNKLPLLKQSFKLMLGQLRPEDQVAIVAYAGSAGEVLEPTPAGERAKILAAFDRLDAGGSTAGEEGLQLAYSVADRMSGDGEVSRVILATDGDFNVGLSDPDALEDYVATKRDSGTYLSVLGFGRGNLDDATMQALAQNGNGVAAYIDTLSEAQKVLVDQLSGALFPIADDVKIQVEFNPAQIAEYRLIGYETRALNREDFNNDRVDAGDIGAGHQVTALYEVTPVGSDARLTDPLRYGETETLATSDELGFLRLRYKAPGESESRLIEQPITADLPPLEDAGFAFAIAGFGQLLRGSTYLGDWGWDEAIALANASKGDDPFGYRAEAVQLMRLAQSLSAQ